jgi:MFS family permease
VLAEGAFARFLAAYFLSLTGTSMVPVALSFTLYGQGAGVGAVGAVLAAETIPLVLFLTIGGTIADRAQRRLVMVGADLLRCAAQGALAALLLSGHAGIATVIALVALVGVGNAFYGPSRNGLLPQIVAPANLQAANGLCTIANSTAAVAGPALGGLFVAITSGAWAIAIDAATYAVSAVLLYSMTVNGAPVPGGDSFLTQLRDGWTEFTRRTWLWAVVLQFALLQLVVSGPLLVLGSYSFAHVSRGAFGWGGLLSMQGAGSVLGGVLAMRLTPRRPLRTALQVFLLFGLMPLSLAVPLPYPAMAGAFFLGGLSVSVAVVLWETTLQQQVPHDRLSRVAAYDYLGSMCLLPLGLALAGPLGDVAGQHGALWIGAAFALVSTLVVLRLPSVRHLEGSPASATG